MIYTFMTSFVPLPKVARRNDTSLLPKIASGFEQYFLGLGQFSKATKLINMLISQSRGNAIRAFFDGAGMQHILLLLSRVTVNHYC